MAGYPFIQAKHYRKGRGGERPIWVVLHTMEAPEKGTTAEAVAAYFRNPPRVGSAHYCVDNNSIIQCVRETDQAAGAAGANRRGLHIEHAGYARQTAAEWGDAYSMLMLARSAGLVADLCSRWGITPAWLSAADLKAGKRGITGHATCSRAFGGTHWDPGPSFPASAYVRNVRNIMNGQDVDRIKIVVNGTDQSEAIKAWLIDDNAVWDATDWCLYASYPRPTYDPGTRTLHVSTEKTDGVEDTATSG